MSFIRSGLALALALTLASTAQAADKVKAGTAVAGVFTFEEGLELVAHRAYGALIGLFAPVESADDPHAHDWRMVQYNGNFKSRGVRAVQAGGAR